jgi:hypothetical protein
MHLFLTESWDVADTLNLTWLDAITLDELTWLLELVVAESDTAECIDK